MTTKDKLIADIERGTTVRDETPEFVETKWEVWSDPIENAKTILPKFLVLTTERQEFVAECRDPNEARLIAAAPAMAEALRRIERTDLSTVGPDWLGNFCRATLKLAGL